MKKCLLFISIVFILSNFSNAQVTIPNGGFETWTDTVTPGSWKTNNNFLTKFVTQTTDKYSGNFAMKVKTVSVILLGNMSGIATLGSYSLLQGISGGVPINSKPIKFDGYFKYNGVNGDSMMIALIMTKWNGTSRDTLAISGVMTAQAFPTYFQFNQNITYSPSTIVPDSFNIIIASSAGYAPQVGSTLFVDALTFTSTTGVEEPISNYIQTIYPNPSTGEFTLRLGDNSKATVSVYNMVGEKVFETENATDLLNIDLTGKAKGMYSVIVIDGNNKKTHNILLK